MSAQTSIKFLSINKSMYSPSQNQDEQYIFHALIVDLRILDLAFFIFGSEEVDVASTLVAHAAASLFSILLRSASTSINFLSINKSMYWPSQNQNEHPSYYTKE